MTITDGPAARHAPHVVPIDEDMGRIDPPIPAAVVWRQAEQFDDTRIVRSRQSHESMRTYTIEVRDGKDALGVERWIAAIEVTAYPTCSTVRDVSKSVEHLTRAAKALAVLAILKLDPKGAPAT